MSIKIHEFSTGINPQKTANGGWISLGFISQYMNATCNPLPHAIIRSIANYDFSIAEGTASDHPAIIGRIVVDLDNSGREWSVVALISRGKDEKGRAASFTRYFFVEGSDHIPNILMWIEEYRRQNGNYPVFNPFDIQDSTRGSSNELPNNANSHDIFGDKRREVIRDSISNSIDSIPVILQARDYNPETCWKSLAYVHVFAKERAEIAEKSTKRVTPVSWAFNVEAVEKIERFTTILPASPASEQLLKRAKQSFSSTPLLLGAMFDEEEIKTALKGMINSPRIKENYFQDFVRALDNRQIDDHWPRVFDALGAQNAMDRKIYNPQMIKLLILKSIAIPRSAQRYFSWIGYGEESSRKNASKFEQDIDMAIDALKQNNFDAGSIESRLIEGFSVIVSSSIQDQKSREAFEYLLKKNSPHRLWKKQSESFLDDLHSDFVLVGDCYRNKTSQYFPNEEFRLNDVDWQDMYRAFWRLRLSRNSCDFRPEYLGLAELFDRDCRDELAAIVYHISEGKIPKKLFNRLRKSYNIYHPEYGDEYLVIYETPIVANPGSMKKCLNSLGAPLRSLQPIEDKQNTQTNQMEPHMKIPHVIALCLVLLVSSVSATLGLAPFFSKRAATNPDAKTNTAATSLNGNKSSNIKPEDRQVEEIAQFVESVSIASKNHSSTIDPSGKENCGGKSTEDFLKALRINNVQQELKDICQVIKDHGDRGSSDPHTLRTKIYEAIRLSSQRNQIATQWKSLKPKIISKQEELVKSKGRYIGSEALLEAREKLISNRKTMQEQQSDLDIQIINVKDVYDLIIQSKTHQ
jgi:hypothetical protein